VSLQLLCHLLVVEGSLMNGLSFEWDYQTLGST
jgi:hypothetical protein